MSKQDSSPELNLAVRRSRVVPRQFAAGRLAMQGYSYVSLASIVAEQTGIVHVGMTTDMLLIAAAIPATVRLGRRVVNRIRSEQTDLEPRWRDRVAGLGYHAYADWLARRNEVQNAETMAAALSPADAENATIESVASVGGTVPSFPESDLADQPAPQGYSASGGAALDLRQSSAVV